MVGNSETERELVVNFRFARDRETVRQIQVLLIVMQSAAMVLAGD